MVPGDIRSPTLRRAREVAQQAEHERRSAVVKNVCFVIEPWSAKVVESELRKRALSPVRESDGNGFELPCEGSGWMGPSDQQRERPNEGSQVSGVGKAVGTVAVQFDRMKDGLAGPSLVHSDQLQRKRFLLSGPTSTAQNELSRAPVRRKRHGK
jgi:hypothetical protein